MGISNKPTLLLMLFIASLAAANDRVVFTIVERVMFSVPGDWPVVSSKSTAEKTVFAFQIPNAAEEGTSDSTNLVIVSSFLKDTQDKNTFEKRASSPDPGSQEKQFVDGWRCYTFSAMQNSTQYGIWDCYRVVADCGIYVRIAWPQLVKNPSGFDKHMEDVLSEFLTSVRPSKKLSN